MSLKVKILFLLTTIISLLAKAQQQDGLGKVVDLKVLNITQYEADNILNVEMKVWRRYINSSYTFIVAASNNPINDIVAYEELPGVLATTSYGFLNKSGMRYNNHEIINVEIPISKSMLSKLNEHYIYLKGFVLCETVVRQFFHEKNKLVLAHQLSCKPFLLSSVPIRKGNRALHDFYANLLTSMRYDLFNDIAGGEKCDRCKGSGSVESNYGGAVECPMCYGKGRIFDSADAILMANKAVQQSRQLKNSSLQLKPSLNHSKGIKTKLFENGDKYTGTFKYGMCHGKGTYIWKNGAKYIGEISYNQMHGKGTLIYANGDKYTGDFYKDYRDGVGITTYTNGTKYEGGYLYDEYEGNGIILYANGDKYIGQFAHGQQNGHGVMSWTDGSSYDGDFKNDQLHGKGTLKFKNGAIYTGDFQYGKRTGMGVYIWEDGTRYEGEFKDGDLFEGKRTYSDGGSFEGRFIFNKRDYGEYKYTNGNRYKGKFKDGLLSGWGTFYWANGNIYKGYFLNNKLHGEGEFFYNDTNVIVSGEWKDGVLINKKSERKGKRYEVSTDVY